MDLVGVLGGEKMDSERFKKIIKFCQGLTPEMVYGKKGRNKKSMSSKKSDMGPSLEDIEKPLRNMGVLK